MEFLIRIRNGLNRVMVVLGGLSVLMLMTLATGMSA